MRILYLLPKKKKKCLDTKFYLVFREPKEYRFIAFELE